MRLVWYCTRLEEKVSDNKAEDKCRQIVCVHLETRMELPDGRIMKI
jgi:hypothetical protein